MATPSDFQVDSTRDATDSIRGYVYQAYQSVLAWMRLDEHEILILEGAEDVDIHRGHSVTTTQVKDVAGSVTLRSQAVLDALNNFWSCCERNPDHSIHLRFLTTASVGKEKRSPLGAQVRGLEHWQDAESERVDIGPLRSFLASLDISSDLKSFLETATDKDVREKMVRRIKWDLGNKPIEGLQYAIEDGLKLHGLQCRVNSHYSCQALPALLKRVADLMSTKGIKELRFGDFLTCFDDATMLSIPRGTMEEIRSRNDAEILAGGRDVGMMSRLANAPAIIEQPLPIVDGGIPRTIVVSETTRLLREQQVIFICGGSGLGKTNLASLTAQRVGGNWGWIGLRGLRHEHVKEVLARAAIEMNARRDSPYLVLDDVDLSQLILFEREFVSLIFSILDRNGMVIVTGPTRPPLQLFPKLRSSEACEFTAPYFDLADISELLRSHGLADTTALEERARIVWATTRGYPQLVHAQVRNMSTSGWPVIAVSDLVEPETVERIRSEARARLLNEISTDRIRVLAYRLSLIKGPFSRDTAIAVAETPPPTALPGEAFDALIGPWIERDGRNRFRVSPLLTGSAEKVLSMSEVKAVHGQIADDIIDRKSIDQYEVGTAFFHAYMAKNLSVLTLLAHNVLTTSGKNAYLLYDAMRWFIPVALTEGQKVFADNLSIDLVLRLVQYRLISSAPKTDNAIGVIERIEETLNEMEESEVKQHSEAMAYVVVLNVLNVNIPPRTAFRLLFRVIDLSNDGIAFDSIENSVRQKKTNVPRMGENKPAQIFFSYQAARISGLEELYELIQSLDALPAIKREHLLRVCDSEIDFASTLINCAWWKDVEGGVLNVERAIEVLEMTLAKSRTWAAPELTKASLVAIAVIHDEYADLPERAIETLDRADAEFPGDATLLNQRAKVLFRANRNAEAFPIAMKALESQSLSSVEFVFCCRASGVAAAKGGDWIEAESLFVLGASKAKLSSVQHTMSVGLMADAGFALWKQREYGKSLRVYGDVLDSLESVPLAGDIRNHHLHATARHTIMWVHLDAQAKRIEDVVEPPPGVCSNQEPSEGIVTHQIVDIAGVWQLLAMTERMLGLDVGISARAAAAGGESIPLIMEGYRRTEDFKSVFETNNVEDLIPKLSYLHETILYSKDIGDEDADQWAPGTIPELPAGYWVSSNNIQIVLHYLLVASVVSIAHDRSKPLPIERWRSDLIGASALSEDVDQILCALDGAPVDNSLEQQAAATVLALRSEVLAPLELWKCSFRLLNTFTNDA